MRSPKASAKYQIKNKPPLNSSHYNQKTLVKAGKEMPRPPNIPQNRDTLEQKRANNKKSCKGKQTLIYRS